LLEVPIDLTSDNAVSIRACKYSPRHYAKQTNKADRFVVDQMCQKIKKKNKKKRRRRRRRRRK
jgi:hypothetical protein